MLRDLGIEELISILQRNGVRESTASRFFRTLLRDQDAIARRTGVFRALDTTPGLADNLEGILPKLRELTVFSRTARETDGPLLQALWRIGELELFVEVVDALASVLGPAAPHSPAFAEVAEYAAAAAAREEVAVLRRELPALKAGLKLRKSVTVGINLDDRFRPREAVLLGVHEEPFQEKSFLAGFLSRLGSGDLAAAPMHRNPSGPGDLPEQLPLSPLFQDLDSMLRSVSRPLLRTVERYLAVNTLPLQPLSEEIALILALHRFFGDLSSRGFATSYARFSRARSLQGLYNAMLALRLDSASGMVTNDLEEADRERSFLVTGPNRGGKTTCIQALGQAQLFSQIGLPVCADDARLPVVESILTHFPQDERAAEERGRFGEEMERLAGIFDLVEPGGLVILNETFSSTSQGEAVAVAREVLDALEAIDSTVYFSTHLSSLAETGTNGARVNLIAEAVVEGDSHRRTFRIRRASGPGASFAADIARRYGVDRDGIRERLSRRGLKA